MISWSAILNLHFSSRDMCHIYNNNTDRDVVVDALGPALQLDQAVHRRQLASQDLLSLGVLHGVDTADVIDRDHAVRGGCRVYNMFVY